MRFRKKPVIVEAEQFLGIAEGVKIPQGVICKGPWPMFPAFIPTLEGNMEVSAGDWVITGVKGERYPCKPDIFEATYEALTLPSAEPAPKPQEPQWTDTELLDWLDHHCSFVADPEYKIGPYKVGDLRKMAKEGILWDILRTKPAPEPPQDGKPEGEKR